MYYVIYGVCNKKPSCILLSIYICVVATKHQEEREQRGPINRFYIV